ncbi:O-acyltransferase WSD1-like isoform X2 [Phoenix dactylifera]|uniref:O-acyltransferase WSD1-like isoform X2 n=1 Tax=Phoenix dactylifera TaxID=42345 RepID=A0A8B7C743_PHODC|nr:O-acyltransferase WSD1-like isoform X2 [Phoenix dactylifera]
MASRRKPLSIKTGRENSGSGVGEKEGGEGNGARNGEITEEEEEEEPMSPAGRLFLQPRFNCHIVSVIGCGKRMDVDAVKAGLEASLARHPRFSSIQVSDEKKLRWVRTKVNVEDHVIVPDLDPDAASVNPDKVVEDYVAALSGAPMDHSRPLWELHILNVATAEAAAVAVLRVHHSLGDGISLMSLLLACTRQCSEPDCLPSIPDARRSTSAAANSRSGLLALLLWIWADLVLAWHTLVDAIIFAATLAFVKDTRTPLMGMEGVEFHPKRFVHRTVSLDDIKDIKKAMNCTVNDVLVGITSAGLSRYLDRRYGEGDDMKKKEKKGLPGNIRLRTALLVNIRRTPGIHALAEMMEKGKGGAKWGNKLGYMVLRFPIAVFEDPLEYIRRGKAIAERKKNSLEAVFTYWSAWVIVKIFGIKAAAALCYRMVIHTTLSFSNIIGPVEKIGFYGHPVVYIAPSVYGHPHALTLHFQSYMNTMKIVLAVDELTIPNPNQLLDDLAESLRLIKDAIARS